MVLDPKGPRTDEVGGSAEAHEYVSIVGSAWLLMGQPAVSSTRTIAESSSTRAAASGDDDSDAPRHQSSVTLVELRRPIGPAEPSGRKNRGYEERFWVSHHWRQVVCGPGRSQRKPMFTAPYLKGPADAPIAAPRERVHVWRH